MKEFRQRSIMKTIKEAETTAEAMLEVLPEWNEIPDLMMEDKDIRPATEAAVKQKKMVERR